MTDIAQNGLNFTAGSILADSPLTPCLEEAVTASVTAAGATSAPATGTRRTLPLAPDCSDRQGAGSVTKGRFSPD